MAELFWTQHPQLCRRPSPSDSALDVAYFVAGQLYRRGGVSYDDALRWTLEQMIRRESEKE